MSAEELEHAYGSRWQEASSVIRRSHVLSQRRIFELDSAWHVSRGTYVDSVERTRRKIMGHTAYKMAGTVLSGPVWYAMTTAVQDEKWIEPQTTIRDIVRDVVLAIVTKDLVGQHGYRQEHYDFLVWPWEQVMGRIEYLA